MVVEVAARNQRDGDDVVREHLPMILATLLNVDDNNLLQPERPLRKHVEFDHAVNLTERPVCPQFLHVQPVLRIGVNVLRDAQLVSARPVKNPHTRYD